ncbi:hypothetical protein GCM10009105_10540 [Dokdonella soli]|uniref:Uncharacterized protein n=1 Tax=Dokdonella soli TaxID=529810 RepID=A0ABN1IDZ9_9GAMM
MAGAEGEASARMFLRRLRKGLDEHTLSPYDFEDVIKALFEVQPIAALDELVGNGAEENYIRQRDLESGY